MIVVIEQQDTRLWGIAVVISNMAEMYARFPEVVQMDGTFKTNCFEYYHEDGVAALRTVRLQGNKRMAKDMAGRACTALSSILT